jgi:hypothetical protein
MLRKGYLDHAKSAAAKALFLRFVAKRPRVARPA